MVRPPLERAPLIAPHAIHPFYPAVVALICNPLLGWPWLVVNAFAIRGSTRRPELGVIVVGFVGLWLVTLGADRAIEAGHLVDGARTWLAFGGQLWVLGLTLIALSVQRRRYERHLAMERFAEAMPPPSERADPPSSPGERARFARDLLERGWVIEAEAEARIALGAEPDEVDALLVLGDARRMLGRPDEALAPYLHATRLAPDRPDLPLRLAVAHATSGHGGAAERVLRAALARWPHDPALLYELALLYLRDGRPAEAQTVAGYLAAQDPHDPQALAIFGDAWVRQGHPEQGVPMARKALARDPDHPIARHALGYARASRSFLVKDWLRHSDWLGRVGRGWAMAPYVFGFALFELGPLLDHPGPTRAGVAITLFYAAFSFGGFIAYRAMLRDELREIGIED